MKHECHEIGKKTISQTYTFPIPKRNGISLELLYKKITEMNWINTSFDPETNQRTSYVSINFTFLGNKQAFNVFRNGKCRAWYSLSPKAFRYFLDFFYYSLIIDCLEEID